MRILFFPSDMGGGFGHFSRCLALAHEATKREHKCAFVVNDNKYEEKINKDFTTFVAPKYPLWLLLLFRVKQSLFKRKSPGPPLFTEISGLDYQVLRDGLTSKRRIKKTVLNYIRIAKEFKPDVLVGDTNLLVWMTGQLLDLPSIQVVRYASHPQTAKLIWWKKHPSGMKTPDTLILFNPLLKTMGLPPIQRTEDLLQGDHYIIPSIPELEPIPNDRETTYVGELTTPIVTTEIPTWFQGIKLQQPLIYITIGGGAGSVGSELFFQMIVTAFKNKPLQVVVSTTEKFAGADCSADVPNIKFFPWVPGRFIISQADLIIFHGGYGTMMETITYGKPSIIIPFHTEQEGNGRRLEQLGCGLVIKPSSEKNKLIKAKWQYGDFNFFIQNSFDVSAEELYEKATQLLSNVSFKNNAEKLQTKIKKYGRAKKALKLIEKIVTQN